GPGITVVRYHDFADALARVNDSVYGLPASISTRAFGRIDQAFRTLEGVGVVANDDPLVSIESTPYGGARDSGRRREGSRSAVEAEPRAAGGLLARPGLVEHQQPAQAHAQIAAGRRVGGKGGRRLVPVAILRLRHAARQQQKPREHSNPHHPFTTHDCPLLLL